MEQSIDPRPVEVLNAIIVSTTIGFDGSAMNSSIQLKSKGLGVNFGGYILHVPADTIEQEDWQTAFGMEYVARVLNTVGVESWEQLGGKAVRMAIRGNQILGIGNLIEDVWFYPGELGDYHQKKAQFQQEALSFYRQKQFADAAMMSQPASEAEQPEYTHPESGDGEEPRKYAAYGEPKQAE